MRTRNPQVQLQKGDQANSYKSPRGDGGVTTLGQMMLKEPSGVRFPDLLN